MSLLDIRAGEPEEVQLLRKLRDNWPEGPPCAYVRHVVSGPQRVSAEGGLEGNSAGFPSHIEDAADRAVLVANELTYQTLAQLFPDCAETLMRGGFAENFVVDSPDLMPSVVCVGDVFKIGTCLFEVSGPRFPCPKVDAWHRTSGLKQMVLERGWAGYFFRVLETGVCQAGDDIVLQHRPHTGYTIERIARGLWGPSEEQENSEEFLSYVATRMPQLMARRYGDTARTKLDRLLAQI